MQKRLGVIGIVVQEREKSAPVINEILTGFGEIIIGRIGIPYRERGVSLIALIIEADTDQVGALTGKVGSVPGVRVKSILV
jgi:putative iron-only hydrogenase system regulator